MMQFDVTIQLHEHRCMDCGRWWASELQVSGDCPFCAHVRISRVLAEQRRLERVAQALRGALTRAKRRRQR